MPWRIRTVGTPAQCTAAVNAMSSSGLTSAEASQLARGQTFLLAEITAFAGATKLSVVGEGQILGSTGPSGWSRMQTYVMPLAFVSPDGTHPTELQPNPSPSALGLS